MCAERTHGITNTCKENTWNREKLRDVNDILEHFDEKLSDVNDLATFHPWGSTPNPHPRKGKGPPIPPQGTYAPPESTHASHSSQFTHLNIRLSTLVRALRQGSNPSL